MLPAGGRELQLLAATASPLGWTHCTILVLFPPVSNSICLSYIDLAPTAVVLVVPPGPCHHSMTHVLMRKVSLGLDSTASAHTLIQ